MAHSGAARGMPGGRESERDVICRSIVIANWKMLCPNDPGAVVARAREAAERASTVKVVICPPHTLLTSIGEQGRSLVLGAQDCHAAAAGAYTGGVSAALLRRAGAHYVLIGHSERRAAGDDDTAIRAKVQNAVDAGLTPVICVGETRAEREAGNTHLWLANQVAACMPSKPILREPVFAYEPVWAIGTEVTPDAAEIAAASATIREAADRRGAVETTVLYGGSVTAANSGDLARIRGIDGLLVGRASLDPAEFAAIVASAESTRPPAQG